MTSLADARELARINEFASRGQLSAMARAVQASLLSEDFADFVSAAWPILEPQTPMRWGWALEAITDHLVAITEGHITRLMVNVPPGMMKSLLVNVMWPAWEWTDPKRRHLRYISTAHKQDLAVRDNMKCRRLITSEWYQSRWPLILTADQNAKLKFENTNTGFREAMAFGSMTGSRGDRVLIDDPLSVDSGNSEADIEATERTFTEALPTRLNDDERSAIVMIMQRIHERDPSGIVLSRNLPYERLILPMEYDSKRPCKTSIGFKDPRKKDGELLFPERFSAKTVASLKAVLGEYAAAGQLQQLPTPRGGGMFKSKYLKLWPAAAELPDLQYIVQSYDTAFTETTTNDPTACTVWAVFLHPTRNINCALLVDAWDDHMNFPTLRQRAISDWRNVYGGRRTKQGTDDPMHPPKRADAMLVENKGSGIDLINDLRRAGLPAQSYNPGRSDKVARAEAVLPMYELELFYVLESSKKGEAGQPVTWARPFTTELAKFGPGAARDDYVDTFTQAARLLRDMELLATPRIEVEEDETFDYHAEKKRRRNPYDGASAA